MPQQQQALEFRVSVVTAPGHDHEVDDERHDVGKHQPDHAPSLPVSCRHGAGVAAEAERSEGVHESRATWEGTAAIDGPADGRMGFLHTTPYQFIQLGVEGPVHRSQHT